MCLVLFFVVGGVFSAGFWVILGVAFRFRASGCAGRLAAAGVLGPSTVAVVLASGAVRSGLSLPDLRTAGVFALAAALGGLVFWLVSRAVTRSVFQLERT